MSAAKGFCMNATDTGISYANNSLLQKAIIEQTRQILEETITDLLSQTLPDCIRVADLGCSSGPNTFQIISQIIDTVQGICEQSQVKVPEIQVFLNDLPGNDFNAIFRSVPSFCERLKAKKGNILVEHCFIVGVPGSFYGRIFPSRSLHFIHSSNSVHWLSKVPQEVENNKGHIHIAQSSPPNVSKAYAEQFQKDFSMFLSSRSEELIPGGRMILTLACRNNPIPWSDHNCYYELLEKSLLDLVADGLVKQADVDSFNVPYYEPYKGEVCEIVQKEGSFRLDKLQVFEVDLDPGSDVNHNDRHQSGQNFAKTMRAGTEQMLSAHFGHAVIDRLFTRFAANVAEHLAQNKGKAISIVISLSKK